MLEKRTYNRFPVEGEGTLTAMGSSEQIKIRLRDISFTGCCVSSQSPVEPGTVVSFELLVYSTILLSGKGSIKNVQSVKGYTSVFFRFGIKFDEVDSPAIRRIINKFMTRRVSEKGKHLPPTDIPY
jgi:c-di-GMP-binding flagellar brake protein YcgR